MERFSFCLALCIPLLIHAFTCLWYLNSTDFLTNIEENVLFLSKKGSLAKIDTFIKKKKRTFFHNPFLLQIKGF